MLGKQKCLPYTAAAVLGRTSRVAAGRRQFSGPYLRPRRRRTSARCLRSSARSWRSCSRSARACSCGLRDVPGASAQSHPALVNEAEEDEDGGRGHRPSLHAAPPGAAPDVLTALAARLQTVQSSPDAEEPLLLRALLGFALSPAKARRTGQLSQRSFPVSVRRALVRSGGSWPVPPVRTRRTGRTTGERSSCFLRSSMPPAPRAPVADTAKASQTAIGTARRKCFFLSRKRPVKSTNPFYWRLASLSILRERGTRFASCFSSRGRLSSGLAYETMV